MDVPPPRGCGGLPVAALREPLTWDVVVAAAGPHPIDGAYARVSAQVGAFGGTPLTAVQFASLDPGLCPDCGQVLGVARVEVTTFGRGPDGRRRYVPGSVGCPEGCY